MGGWCCWDRDSAADSQPPGLGHPVTFFGPLHAVDLQLAGHHVNDAGLKQALGVGAVQVQGRDGAESALQAHYGQIPGVLMHLAGKRVPAAAHVERQDRGLDGAGDVDGRHVYCGNLQYIGAARGNARVGRVGKRKPAGAGFQCALTVIAASLT